MDHYRAIYDWDDEVQDEVISCYVCEFCGEYVSDPDEHSCTVREIMKREGLDE